MIALSNIAQGSAVLGMIYLQRKDAEAQEVNVPACISCYLGVTEPAMFGVNLKHSYPFICGMIGSACAAIVCVATGTTANAIGVGGLPGILSIQPQYMLSFAICMVIAVAVPFVLTVIVGKKKMQTAAVTEEPAVEKETVSANALKAYVTGNVISLKEVNDGVFSEGIMGDGLAIVPEEDVLYAPADATVCAVMEESRHACGLALENGMEILLHIGIDTVAMKGDGFEYLIKDGQQVKAGAPLLRFNREKIKAAGKTDTVVCVITNPGSVEKMNFVTGLRATANKTTIVKF